MTNARNRYSTALAWAPALLAGLLLCAPTASWANPTEPRLSDVTPRPFADPDFGPPVRIPRFPAPISPDATPLVEVDRDGDQLRDEIRPRPTDVDVADTALVFTNRSQRTVEIRCISRGHNGSIIGQAGTHVPPSGLRYIRASDFSDGRDYVGSAECKSNRRVISSAILFGEEITRLDSKSRRQGRGMNHFFPVVATY